MNLGRIEEDGIDLSGGQWRRVALSRALISEAAFVILDEPTSALDPLAETEILKSFIEMSQGKTAVIISHRVGLCRYADRILVMKEGRLCESGSFEQLMGKKGAFFKMFQAQAHWYNQKKEVNANV